MKNLYHKMNAKTFNLIAFSIAVLGDALLFAYIYLKFSQKELFQRIMNEAWKSKGYEGTPSINFMTELFEIWCNSLLTMMVLLGLTHFLIFLLWLAGKKTPTKYVKYYFKMAMFGFPLMGLALLFSDPFWGIVFIIYTAAYYFNNAGQIYYSSEKSGEIK